MKYRIIITKDEETGEYIASCPELPGLNCTAGTLEEARAKAREAIDLYLDATPESMSAEDSAKFDSALERLKQRRNTKPLN
jgi:predicted RNase H-like HicB family nuclease